MSVSTVPPLGDVRRAQSILRGKKIICFTKYEEKGASSRMRFHQYAPALERAGVKMHFYPLLTNHYVDALYRGEGKSWSKISKGYLRRIQKLLSTSADLIWIEKELFPFLPELFERLITVRDAPYVVDYDDAIFHNYDLHSNYFVRFLLRRKLDSLLRGAALVTAGNAYLARYARDHGAQQILSLPTVVDLQRYPQSSSKSGTYLRVGWIGTQTNERYLSPVLNALERIHRSIPVKLVTVGIGSIDGLRFPQEVHAWSEDTEGCLVSSFDIGVMPLFDSPWEYGKCGYKLIQCMAAGVPVIASKVGANSDIVDDAVGRLVVDESGWEGAIIELASNRALRLSMGLAARERVRQEFSLEASSPRLLAAFAGLFTKAQEY